MNNSFHASGYFGNNFGMNSQLEELKQKTIQELEELESEIEKEKSVKSISKSAQKTRDFSQVPKM